MVLCALLLTGLCGLGGVAFGAEPSANAALARRHFLGEGVTQDYAEALRLYRLAAEEDDPEGQNGVGACYAKGVGVRRDPHEAARWFQRAAEQGLDKAQLNLADCFWDGTGVDRDPVQALMWAAVAAVGGSRDGLQVARRFADRMRASEVVHARSAAQEWLRSRRLTTDLPELPRGRLGRLIGTGTGFFVSADGILLTCRHVVAGGNAVWVRTRDGVLLASVLNEDAASDLAVLDAASATSALPLADSSSVELGQAVFTVGFPNVDLQGFSPKMTRGDVSSLAGFRDDPRTFQISVPVQPGNSGGALVDTAGNVVGVISAQLSHSAMAASGRAAPQNVNYAIKIGEARALLGSVRRVRWTTASHRDRFGSGGSLTPAVRDAEAASVLVLTYSE